MWFSCDSDNDNDWDLVVGDTCWFWICGGGCWMVGGGWDNTERIGWYIEWAIGGEGLGLCLCLYLGSVVGVMNWVLLDVLGLVLD